MKCRFSVNSAFVRGIEAIPITVEVAISNGIPGIVIVGMADTAVQEARERVRAAVCAAGFSMPNNKIVVNLAPGSLRKCGSGFDLPIALGILAVTGQIDPRYLERRLFIGELSLRGDVRSIAGTLAFGICAKKMRLELVSAGSECAPIDGLCQFRLKNLADLRLEKPFENASELAIPLQRESSGDVLDFRDVAGHEAAKRAIQIAVAGKHGILMMGPPGSGKTMLAERVVSILPKLGQEEMLEAAVVHSVAGKDIESILSGARPFRKPHHSATTAGLIGGGTPIRPGEVSLAHRGVLFLDELPEFKPATLQCLRQPMESGGVYLTRADGNIAFPADFMLVAAANPCPCGYYGDDKHTCKCTVPQIRQYQNRIGGPLLDRIDLQIDVCRLSPNEVLDSGEGTDSETLRKGVMKAKEFALWRERKVDSDFPYKTKFLKTQGSPKQIIESCNLKKEAKDFVISMADAYLLSGRAIVSILGVARTIADISQKEEVTTEHLAEAIGFRLRTGEGNQ